MKDYLPYLKNEKGNAPGSCIGVLTGLRFFYQNILKKEISVDFSLPKRFVRIRHYGILANRNWSANLSTIRQLMGLSDPPEKQNASVEERMRLLFEIPESLHDRRIPLLLQLVYLVV
ncbi:MAG: hypothetical protein GY797_07810 [Deltaproteobacteria bacterium]|nr:hypothetical protein [Deltaproteobacteria bacterium]